jgi:hypothetical protein
MVTPGLHNRISTDTQVKSAAYTTISTGGFYFPRWMLDIFGDQGSHRTALDAFSARDTNRFLEWFITKGCDSKLITPIGHVNGVNAYDFPAGSDAYATLDAFIRIEIKERIACVEWKIFGYPF